MYSNDVVRTMATAALPPDKDSGEDCPVNWATQQQSHASALPRPDDEPLMESIRRSSIRRIFLV